MVNVEGIHVENPTAVWMQLKNTREVLKDKASWNSGGWFNGLDNTMCLSNAIRHVVRGKKERPGNQQRSNIGSYGDVAEKIVLRAIHLKGTSVEDIPHFNDSSGRRHHEILAVIDLGIELIQPYAQQHTITVANEILTDKEKREMRLAAWKAEDEMWAERRKKWGIHKDKKGKWRARDGTFARVPRWIKGEYASPAKAIKRKAKQSDAVLANFRRWLDGHEARGWETFWDELADCGDDQDCREKVLAATE